MSMRSGSPQADSAVPAAHPVGTLVSVNVGLPKDVPWQGRTVFTGIFKDPVTGPRGVGKLNVEGDGQGDLAGHGGEQRAVFVYQLDSYRYWERELGRKDFVHGQFGENFTVDGPNDDEVCIGDRYRIVTAKASTSACSRKVRFRQATRSSSWRPAPSRCRSRRSTLCCISPGTRANNCSERFGSRL